ncbi:hypothetical protein G7054_g2580 [Neopestalotiopsis clavispora]|nr:hypothetical protein G7054_g2580 [Neopestalotiopsis clavispora]
MEREPDSYSDPDSDSYDRTPTRPVRRLIANEPYWRNENDPIAPPEPIYIQHQSASSIARRSGAHSPVVVERRRITYQPPRYDSDSDSYERVRPRRNRSDSDSVRVERRRDDSDRDHHERRPAPINPVGQHGTNGRLLSFHLNLLPNDLGVSNKRPARVETMGGMHPESGPVKREDIDILASMSYGDGDDGPNIALTCRGSPQSNAGTDKSIFHWRHVTRENMDMDEFLLLALKIPQISEDMKLLVSQLMKKVNATTAKPFCGGRYTESTSLRYDGRRVNEMDRPDLHVTWLSFPYAAMYDYGSFRTDQASPLPLHSPRSLLQTLYNYESTIERDAEQLFPTVQKGYGKKILHASTTWFLICGEEAVLSYGPTSLDDLFAPRISRNPERKGSPKLIRIVDPYRRLFFIPLENCKNFFTFREIVLDCLKDISLSLETCTFMCNEKTTVLASSSWHEVISSAKTSIITVEMIREKYLTAGEIAAVHDKPKDEGSSSEEEDLAQRVAAQTLSTSTQLIAINRTQHAHQIRKEAKQREQEREKAQELRNEGYLVNEQDSLRKPETVKIFRWEPDSKTKAEEGTSDSTSKELDPTSIEEQSPRVGSVPSASSTKTAAENKPLTAATEDSPEKKSVLEGVDPFFSWPLDAPSEEPSKVAENKSKDDASGLSHVLDRVNDKIKQPDFDITSGHPLNGSDPFKQGRFHQNIESSTFDEFSQLWQKQRLRQAAAKDTVPDAFGTASSGNPETQSVDWKVRHRLIINEIATKYKLLAPEKPFDQCKKCWNGEVYKTADEVVSHLRQDHFTQKRSFSPEETEQLQYWTMSSEHEFHENWNQAQLDVLEAYHDDIERIYKRGQEIRDGVAMSLEVEDAGTEKSRLKHIALPTALVRAFRNLALLLMCTAYSLKLNDNHFTAERTSEKGRIEQAPKYSSVLIWVGVRAYFSIEEAYKDVTLMIRTDSSSDTVKYAAVGPRFIITSICHQLASTRFGPGEGKRPADIYEEIVSNLRYQAYYGRPSRRLLGTIQAAQEELEAMTDLNLEQWSARNDFNLVNSPRSFRISDLSRRQQYDLEDKLDDDVYKTLHEEWDRLQRLRRRLGQLEVKARHRIEILDEDHGKAILVFTVITLIFLPLSFVTSYLGMNTVDIRDMDNSQALFWTIAIPVTAVILGLAALVAYKGDDLRERFLGLNVRQGRAPIPWRIAQWPTREVTVLEDRRRRKTKRWLRRKGPPRRRN